VRVPCITRAMRLALRRCLPATGPQPIRPFGIDHQKPSFKKPSASFASSSGTASTPAPAVYASRDPKRFEAVVLPLIRAFVAREGHCDVPFQFRVDKELAMAAGVHETEVGMSLGRCLSLVQGQHHYLLDKKLRAGRIAALRELGFDPTDETRWQRVLAALRWYKAETGTADVRRETVLGAKQLAEAGLPPHLAPFRLGKLMNNIRDRGDYISSTRKKRGKGRKQEQVLPPPDYKSRARVLHVELGVSKQEPAHKTSRFKGVAKASANRWRAKAPAPGNEYLGTFGSEEEAARSYDAWLVDHGMEPANFGSRYHHQYHPTPEATITR